MTKLLMKDCAWIALCSLARDGRDTLFQARPSTG